MSPQHHSARRLLAAVVLPLALGLGLTACGGDEEPDDAGTPAPADPSGSGGSGEAGEVGDVGAAADAPDDITVAEFCAPGEAPVPDPGLEDDPEAAARAARDAAAALIERGTPTGFSEEGREGFEALADYFAAIDADELAAIPDTADPAAIFGDAGPAVEAYLEEAVSVCVGQVPTELPTELPSELPELPGDLPTDLPELPDLPSGVPTELPDVQIP